MDKKDNLLIIKRTVFGIVTTTALFSISYAILRYNVFGTVPWSGLPFFVMNKAISLTAIILFTIGFVLKPKYKNRVGVAQKWLDISKIIENITFLFIVIHVLMSLMLFKSEIFAKFFEENGTLSLIGGLSMIAGIISFVLLCEIKLNSISKIKINYRLLILPKVLNVTMLFIIIHLFFMGYSGWITIAKWHGGMPPISLIAFLFSSFGLLLKLFFAFQRTILKSKK
jgi:hypothetical protein